MPSALTLNDELSAMTITELKAYAEDKGIIVTATKKADIIAEIIEQL